MDLMKIVSSNQRQIFSLPPNCIYYMLQNPSSYIAFIKLYKTCKYFYLKKKLFFFVDADYDDDDRYFFQAGVQYWFAGKLLVRWCRQSFPLHYIYRCSIKEFQLMYATITLNDFLLIVKENTIKNFFLAKGFIKNSDGSNVGMDIVLQNLPNVEIFIFNNANIESTQKQLENIETINLWNKLKKFSIIITWASENDVFDPMPLIRFIQKNATSEFFLQIIIDGKNSQKNFETLKNSAESYLKNLVGNMEIYHQYIPHSVLYQRMHKMAAERKAAAKLEIK